MEKMTTTTANLFSAGDNVSLRIIPETFVQNVGPEEENDDDDLSDSLWMYVAPCILVTGICGNALVLLVMSQGRMRGTSTCVYLLTMAVADLVALVTGLVPEWLATQDVVNLKEVHPMLCKAEKFLSYTSTDASIWACVAFTVDRFVAVCFPMDSAHLCPPQNARYYAVAVFFAAVCKNLHVFATRGQQLKTQGNETVVEKNCGSPNEAFLHFETYVRPWIAFAVVNALPFVVIVFCNLFIVRAMIRLRRSYRQSVVVSAKDASTTIQMAVLSLSASVCFLVCVTPSMVLLIGKAYWDVKSKSYLVAKAAANLTFYVNHSVNFFLYCITGGKFRAELRALFLRTVAACWAAAAGATPPRSSMCRVESNSLIYANKLQQDDDKVGGGQWRGEQTAGNHYASTPCVSRLDGGGGGGGERATVAGRAAVTALRAAGSGVLGAIGYQTKALSDADGLYVKQSRV